jgi:uncharacterized membrane protein
MADFRRDTRLDQPRDPRLRLPRFDPEAFGRWSEAIARSMGTARFIVYMTIVIIAWFAWNTLAPGGWRFDPYTFTFLTLVLSLQASYAAPLILLAQNRQADRDRLALEEDRRRAAMQKADTEFLAREIASLRIALGEVATRDFLRSELNRLVEELDDAVQRRQKAERKEQRRAAGRPNSGPLDEPADRPEGPTHNGRRPAELEPSFDLDPTQATRPIRAAARKSAARKASGGRPTKPAGTDDRADAATERSARDGDPGQRPTKAPRPGVRPERH